MSKDFVSEKTLRGLAAFPDGCSVATLADAARLSRKEAQRRLDVLRGRGLVERVSLGTYRLTAAGRAAIAAGARVRSGPKGRLTGERRPARSSFRHRLWTALRRTRKATIPELLQIAGTGAEGSPATNAWHYLDALARAGYVRRMPRREAGTKPTSNGFCRWLLVNDPGPEHPVLKARGTVVWDPNSGQRHTIAREREAPRSLSSGRPKAGPGGDGRGRGGEAPL